ncbi:TetR/AcrR family transcriptional regulator [Polaromonas glacialis]|uniref:TetR/AcrR family transcriptional regulator n=1 Tax=Polaromonas glacialis TaxID=866564 RepID=UPI000497F2E0|nr:TetR/AcrR family transcriptional regulator [Polaromonas glacialis]
MRYTNEYKEQARAKLVDAGGRHAKRHGFISSGMADLAAAAGVTTGSLYKHFSGKSDLFVAMITAELKRTADMYAAVDAADPVGVSRALAGYLSLSHVQHPEMGCPLPSLTPEIGRSEDAVRLAFEQGVQTIHANVSALTGNSDTAWAVMAQNVGAVMLARAMRSEAMQHELLDAVRNAGEHLIRSDKPNQMAGRS